MPPVVGPDTVQGVVAIPTWLLLTALGGAIVALAGVVWKLVMMGRADLKVILPVLRENNELLREVKEFLR